MNDRDPAPLVSLGLPVFNGERFVAQALDSIVAQTHANFELTICDNASTDRTESICRAYSERDPRVRYHRNPENRGLAWNFNRVRELSSGPYFKWVAYDDLCAPAHVARCVEVLEREPSVVLCYTRANLIDDRGTRVGECVDNCHAVSARPSVRLRILVSNLRLSNPMFGVIRASALGPTPIGGYVASDVALLVELALRGGIYEVSDRLFSRREHSERVSRSHADTDDQATVYDPTNAGKVHLPSWRLLREHLASIRRVPMSPQERLRCYAIMAKVFRWRWARLRSELGTWTRSVDP